MTGLRSGQVAEAAGVNLQTLRYYERRGLLAEPEGLQTRARQKLAEVDARIADLTVIRETLHAALEAGCDDLITCAATPQCPLPFADLAHDSVPSRSEYDNDDAP